MYHELTTLLPRPRRRALMREYLFRLATLTAIMLAVVITVHGILLIPVAFYLERQASEQQTHLATLASSGTQEEKTASARLTSLESDATYLSHLGSVPTISSLVRAILQVPRQGITLIGFTYTPPVPAADGSAGSGKLLLSGVATTRDALRQYDLALSQLPFVANADLPISAYAKETDIPFSITLTGTLTP